MKIDKFTHNQALLFDIFARTGEVGYWQLFKAITIPEKKFEEMFEDEGKNLN